jgi:fermentation-respiration switch protein FrsA (DUF1100 family)
VIEYAIGGIALAIAILYGAVLLTLVLMQRRIVFNPSIEKADLKAAGLAEQMAEVQVSTPDGLMLTSWWAPAMRPDGRVIVYFHGNAGHLGGRAERIRAYLEAGYGILLVGYRGYGGNPGIPSETGLYTDARANLDFLAAHRVRPAQTILFGESLGTAVAIQMAIERNALALILEAPLASVLRSARVRYPLFAFDFLVKDKFDSFSKIAKVRIPVLIIHGERDHITRVQFGRMLFEAANEPKYGHFLPEAGHSDLIEHGLTGKVMEFLDSLRVPG